MSKIVGSSKSDTLIGGASNDEIYGYAGTDLLRGGGGADSLYGGDGTDQLFGDDGDDLLWGEQGTDSLVGGDGRDTLVGGAGDDSLDGGAGVDIAIFSGKFSDYQITTSGGVTIVKDLRKNGPDGVDTITNVERLQFSDKVVFLTADNAPTSPIDADPIQNSAAEGSAAGTLVGITATSTDSDLDPLTYSIVLANGTTALNDGRFAIDPNSGVVTVFSATALNYETATSHTLTIRASDGFGGTADRSFTIQVTDVAPTQPTDSNAVANSISEGAANGDQVGITASSSDVNGGTVTFSLIDNAGGRFAIDPTSGVVTVANATKLDYESATSHSITVKAADASGSFTTQSFTIMVTDVAPTQPVDGNAVANSVSEGAANGTLVGITAASSDVHGGAVTYSLSDDAGGRFAINSSTGAVSVANGSLLDYETATSHSITVKAADASGSFTTQSFTIHVTDVAPTQPTDSNAAANSISEGAANGDQVGITASSSDVNGGVVTYSLTDNAGGRFAIDPTSGVVTVADASKLDYESNAAHSITVKAGDASGLFTTQNFTIAVTDVAPTQPTDSDGATGGSISEGAASGDKVGITASSSDINGGVVTFSLTDSADGRFAINASTGVVTVADATKLDYESATSHSITVKAADPSGAFTMQSFTIAVTDVAPTQPTDSNAAANSISEGAANGDKVGITASSSDVNGGAVTFSLTDNADGRFAINASTGVVTVADATKLDYETNTSHQITVKAADASGAFTTQSFTIQVTDIAPTQPTDSDGATGGSISEGAGNGDEVGITASSSDVNGGAVTFSLTYDADGRFAIDPTSGVVTVADASKLNYESNTVHGITVKAADASGAFTTENFTILVTDVAPTQPIDFDGAAGGSISEGARNFSEVGIFAISSDVNGGIVTYSLSDDAGGRFAIDSLGLVTVIDATKLDYESATSHSITVRAADESGAFTTQNFTIQVTDVAPTQPTDANAAANSISEGAANGDQVGITASSSDVNGGTVSYSLTDNAGGRFAIDPTSGVVTVADATKLDYETNTAHSITVKAADASGAFTTQSFTIAVTDVAPTQPTDSNAAANSISEGAANGDKVGITASSSDVNGGAVTFSLTYDADGRFAIDPTNGVVTVADASKLDYESATSHSITVKAADVSGSFTTQSFTIQVANSVPTAPTDSDGPEGAIVSESLVVGSAVGIHASSLDVNGGTVTYSFGLDASNNPLLISGPFAIDPITGVISLSAPLDYEDKQTYQLDVYASDGTSQSGLLSKLTGVSIPVGSNDGGDHPVWDNVWSVTGEPVNDTVGIGYLVNPSYAFDVYGGFALHDHQYIDQYRPDPARAVITFQFESPVNVRDIRVIEHGNGVTKLHVYAGNSLDSLTDVGGVFGEAGDLTGSGAFIEGQANDFHFSDNTISGTYFRVVVEKTSYDAGWAIYRMFPGGGAVSTFTVDVTDVAPTQPTDSDGAIGGSISESAANGNKVGITAASSDVNGGVVTYSLTDSAGGRFAIDASTGVVTVANGALLDYETSKSHSITVQAADASGSFTTQSFTIAVTDVAPTTPVDGDTAHANTLAENAALDSYTGLTLSSFDPNGGAVTYALAPGSHFKLAPDGHSVLLSSALDYETAPNSDANGRYYEVSATAKDGSGAVSGASTFKIYVTDVSENTILYFDDLPNFSSVPAGYDGVNVIWHNFVTLESDIYSIQNSGYVRGTVSGDTVVFNPGGDPSSIDASPGDTFDFRSVYMTAAWNDNLHVRVDGYKGGSLVYSTEVIISDDAPTFFQFDYMGITELTFTSFGGTDAGTPGGGEHVAFDNFLIV